MRGQNNTGNLLFGSRQTTKTPEPIDLKLAISAKTGDKLWLELDRELLETWKDSALWYNPRGVDKKFLQEVETLEKLRLKGQRFVQVMVTEVLSTSDGFEFTVQNYEFFGTGVLIHESEEVLFVQR